MSCSRHCGFQHFDVFFFAMLHKSIDEKILSISLACSRRSDSRVRR